MKPVTIGSGVVAWVGAALSSLCCLLPLAVIGLGLGSGAFMAVTMPYRWLLIPAGVALLGMRRVGRATGLASPALTALAGSAGLCLAAGVVHLDPEQAVRDAMLEGWGAQMTSRGLNDACAPSTTSRSARRRP